MKDATILRRMSMGKILNVAYLRALIDESDMTPALCIALASCCSRIPYSIAKLPISRQEKSVLISKAVKLNQECIDHVPDEFIEPDLIADVIRRGYVEALRILPTKELALLALDLHSEKVLHIVLDEIPGAQSIAIEAVKTSLKDHMNRKGGVA